MHVPRVRASALTGAVIAALVGAPVAEAASPRTSLRTARTTGAPETVTPGTSFVLRTTVTNYSGRSARGARVFASLRRAFTRNPSLPRVGNRALGNLRAGRSSRYDMRIRVSAGRSGTYYLVLCVTNVGRRASCNVVRRLEVRAAPTATPAAPAAPAATPPATPPAPPAAPVDVRLREAVNRESLSEHLNAFQAIADANGGTRAAATQGYDDSALYVARRLARAGYEPTIDSFSFVKYEELAPAELERLTPEPKEYVFDTDFTYMEYSDSGEVSGDVRPVDINLAGDRASDSGCEDEDFAGFPAGAIALLQRGTCTFGEKATNAAEAGADGVIIFNQGNTPDRSGLLQGTLGGPVALPVLGTTFAVGQELAEAGTTARMLTATRNTPTTTFNVLADTPGGDPNRVVVVGGHLDSVEEGPGINDNGTGTAAILEVAEQMSALGITPVNKVRFAFWGAEEAGLQGSTAYVAQLTEEQVNKLSVNLNFDMLGSPNFARLVYDGDGDPTGLAGPPGSAAIEKAFTDFFASQGLATDPTEFSGRSDYGPFIAIGIPAGGLFSGAERHKTEDQVAKFGGTAGEAFDRCYHESCDTIANVNFTGLEQLADGVAQVTYQYAMQDALPAGPQTRTARAKGRSAGEYLGRRLQR